MASWAVLEEQRVWISPHATAFTVACSACAQLAGNGGYGSATVSRTVEPDTLRTVVECSRGHRIRVEREGR